MVVIRRKKLKVLCLSIYSLSYDVNVNTIRDECQNLIHTRRVKNDGTIHEINRGGVMNISERRKKILEIFYEKKSLSYKEILEETSESGDAVDILSDIDTLVFFRFLQNVGVKRSEINSETKLELRPNTKEQMENNPSRIDSRLKELEHEVPSWFRKLAIFNILENNGMTSAQMRTTLCDQFTHVRWHPSLTEASLRILKECDLLSESEKGFGTYTLTLDGKNLLKKSPIQKFLCLRTLKDEFTNEFRTFVILDIVGKYDETGGISSKRIIHYLQKEYGIRGNKKKTILNTLDSMVLNGLLLSERHVYHLSPYVKSFQKREKRPKVGVKPMNDYHSVQDLKETVELFFENYKIPNFRDDMISSVRQILLDLEQCDQDLSLRSPQEWVDHIVFLSGCLQDYRADTWEKTVLRCIAACILSRLLPSKVSASILLDHPPPFSLSRDHRDIYERIAREYYYRLTEVYLDLGENEKAFQSFEYLRIVSWEFFEFLMLKGTVEMKKGSSRDAVNTFERALELSEKDEKKKIVALFHVGLAHYQRGDFREAEKTWEQCLNLECTVDQEIIVRHNVANAYRMSGKLERARKFYEDSIAFAERYPEKEEFVYESYLGQANILIDLCSWGEAERILGVVTDECERKGFPLISALAKTNLGVILNRKGRYEEALSYHEEALDHVDKISNPQEYAMILINKGDTLLQIQRTDEALAALKEALELIGSENKVLVQTVKISLAEAYSNSGNLQESRELSYSVLQERWLGNRRLEAEALRIQGKVSLRKNEFSEAEESLKESGRIFKELNLKYELLQVYNLLEKCYKNLKNGERETYYKNVRRNLAQQIGLLS